MAQTHLTPLLSFLIASAVLLSSLHAVQVLGAVALAHDESNAKVMHDIHHHTDKSAPQLIKDAGDSSQYVDSRSMRLMRDKKTIIRDKLARWQRAWEEFLVAHKIS
jgi:hypothetical protein